MPESNFSINKPAYNTIFEFYRDIILQYSFFLWKIINDKFFSCVTNDNSKNEHYQSSLKQAKTFKEWNYAAKKLDILEGYTQWADDPKSSDYDWKLLQKRIDEIESVRKLNDDRKSMIFALKLSLTRNLGDMGNPKLYTKSRVGTKKLISDYTDTVIEQLNWIGENSTDLTLKEKHDYFMSLRQGYGRTALLLSGGGTLGFFHIGVLKTMINARLLPRIISGASTGSIMASMICTLNEQDRIKVLNSPWSIPLKVFERPEFPESLLFRVNRYLLEGNLYDPNILKSVLIDQFGDITFQEAYNKSRLILNITVSSSSLFDMPRVLNYITAPDVVVWSSVLASCSVPLFYPAQEIYMKTKTGKLIPWTSTVDKYRDGSIDNDLPLKKVSELFSVNNFIVVQCLCLFSKLNPHVAPFLHKSNSEPSLLRTGFNFCLRMVKEEFQHRFVQLKELGISPNAIMRLENVLSQRYLGDITIAPELSFKDVSKILSNPDFESANNFIERGERATWPSTKTNTSFSVMTKINCSLKIELAIDAAIYKLRSTLLGESPKLPLEVLISKPYFPMSNCSGSTLYLTLQMSSHSADSQSLSDYQSTDDEEEVLPQSVTHDESNTNRLSSLPMMPPTPLWQVDDYEKQLPIFMEKNQPEMTPFTSAKCRPSLLPHDISRRGSNLSIRDISPSTSTKFERRKQITSTQFFISPDFEWRPDTSDKEFRESISVVLKDPKKSSFLPQKRKNLSITIPK
ncbi:acyl transferase/acyl hydrolase/lysophospholipase [Pilaira anomala]|nr:acyl transferase/acyl hydrolase/lysophospholipase [Pilaira anomala]